MIIDVSNTIGRHKFKAEITAESLLQQMDAAGIDKAVISCYAESLDNESVYRAITAYPDRFIGGAGGCAGQQGLQGLIYESHPPWLHALRARGVLPAAGRVPQA